MPKLTVAKWVEPEQCDECGDVEPFEMTEIEGEKFGECTNCGAYVDFTEPSTKRVALEYEWSD